jgi:hypothetical protein
MASGHIALLALLLIPGTPTRAEESPRELGRQLVRVMGVDEHAALGVQRSVSQNVLGEAGESQRECIRRIGRDEFTESLGSIAAGDLTPSEMLDAIQYFLSPIGIKHLRTIREQPGATRVSMSSFSREDQSAMRAFLDTMAGYRLMTRGLLTSSPEARSLFDRKVREALRKCQAPPGTGS